MISVKQNQSTAGSDCQSLTDTILSSERGQCGSVQTKVMFHFISKQMDRPCGAIKKIIRFVDLSVMIT